MADYIISNDFKTLEEIWDDLLRLHWDYLDTEENMDKLKMRRKLEGTFEQWSLFVLLFQKCLRFYHLDELKDFLSIVQHDRKFFLTETAHVFKQTVMKLDQFSAYKALMGFEAISQYANNLFRKPWRKEYRSIKVIVSRMKSLKTLSSFNAILMWKRNTFSSFSCIQDIINMRWRRIWLTQKKCLKPWAILYCQTRL